MKENKHIILFLISIIIFGGLYFESNIHKRFLHEKNLQKSPFTETKKLSRDDRKAKGLPPDAYYERIWELTMDPILGRPKTENIFKITENKKHIHFLPMELELSVKDKLNFELFLQEKLSA